MNNLLLKTTCITLFLFPFLPYIKEFNFILGNIIELSLICVIIIINICSNLKKINKVVFFQMIIILFFILFLLINIRSKNLSDGLSALRIYIEPFIIGISFTNIYVKFGKSGITKILSTILLSVLIICILGIIQFIFPDIILKIRPSGMYKVLRPKSDFISLSVYNRVMSIMNDPNVYSVFLVVIYPIVDLLKYSNDKFFKRIYLYKLLIITNIILTNSRQGMILILFYIIISKFINRYLHEFSNIIINLKLILKYIINTIILILTILNIDKIINSVLEIFRIDTLHNLNGREDKNTIVKKMLFDRDFIYILFGNGLNTGREFIFENSFNLIISQVGIIGIFIVIFVYFIFYKSFPIKSKGFIKREYIYILTFIILMYSGDYILIPQVSIYFFIVVFSLVLFENKNIHLN